jgi:hypothetical protein
LRFEDLVHNEDEEDEENEESEEDEMEKKIH